MAVAPRPPKGSKSENRETRAQAWKRRTGNDHQMPDVGDWYYLVRHWNTLGRLINTGMGRTWLSWQEIHAWTQATGTELQPFEKEWLHTMSRAYVSMLHEAEDPNCQPPYLMEMKPVDRNAISEGIRRVFGAFIKDRDGKK